MTPEQKITLGEMRDAWMAKRAEEAARPKTEQQPK
jgi:hypothetical protein